uniref:Putative ovule protein n=1 Tax=Solanum chacoense TaxID=4108 RepID=A0A0V0GK52_SOLCH
MVGNIYFTAGEKSFEVVDISDDHSRWFLWTERSRRFTSRIKIDANNLIWVCEAMKQASRGIGVSVGDGGGKLRHTSTESYRISTCMVVLSGSKQCLVIGNLQ